MPEGYENWNRLQGQPDNGKLKGSLAMNGTPTSPGMMACGTTSRDGRVLPSVQDLAQ